MIDRDFPSGPLPDAPRMPYDIDPEERARQLAHRDLVTQRAMSIIGIGNTLPDETTQATGRNADMEKA